ncbi:MAG: trypsin-like peptidase domain-containing protein [Chloroflexota bacterium]
MSDMFKQLSDSMAATVETASPSIVRIEGRHRRPASGVIWSEDGVIVTASHVVHGRRRRHRGGRRGEHGGERGGDQASGQVTEQTSEQTDEQASTQDGEQAIDNNTDSDTVNVGLADGRVVSATLIGRDPGTDLALLRLNMDELDEGETLSPATWVEADELGLGQLVLATARPGEDVQATLGVLSGILQPQLERHGHRGHRGRHGHHGRGRNGRGRNGRGKHGRGWAPWGRKGRHHGKHSGKPNGKPEQQDEATIPETDVAEQMAVRNVYLQTDVLMYPGFSGGPLVTAGGGVAGINSSGLARGVSLSIPTSTVQRVVNTLLTHGRMPRGYLGITTQPVRLSEAMQTELEQETGVMVMSVEADKAADQGGIVQGDVIVGLDGEPVRHIDELHALLTSERVGQETPVQVIRGGQVQEVVVTIGEA